MTLRVLDIWHGEEKEVMVYSSQFDSLEDFLMWVYQHQGNLKGVEWTAFDEYESKE
jgi:hypothetical protein